MKYFLVTILLSLVLNAGEPTCYTVQLLSRSNSVKNHDVVLSNTYDSSCKIMEIGTKITVRCGCFDKYVEAKSHKVKLRKKFKNAYVLTTYKSRFNVERMPVVENLTKKLVAVEEKAKVINLPKKLLVKESTPVLVLQSKKEEKKKEKRRKKKNKSQKKEKKEKIIKKRKGTWFYDRYLDDLKSKKPNKFYGYEYSFGAQLSYDIAYFDESQSDYYKNDWRRVRINHKGSFLDKKLFYELEYSFTGDSSYKDVYLGYENKIKIVDSEYRIKVGNIKIPFSLERYTTSKNITFMERALNDAFSENRKLGAEVLLYKKINNSRINLFTALYTNSIDENRDDEIVKNGYSLRATYAYKFKKRHQLSLGFGFQGRDMNGDDLKINQGAEAKFVNKKYVSVSIKDVKDLTKFNLEALYIYEKYSLQAEYTQSMISAYNTKTELQNYDFDAYYVQGSYFLIGKGKKYKFKTATLGKIKPNRDGAVEIAARYSYINLIDITQDKKEDGGTQEDISIGLNWYINNEIKVMFNYIVAKPDVYKDTPEDSYQGLYQVMQGRLLFSF